MSSLFDKASSRVENQFCVSNRFVCGGSPNAYWIRMFWRLKSPLACRAHDALLSRQPQAALWRSVKFYVGIKRRHSPFLIDFPASCRPSAFCCRKRTTATVCLAVWVVPRSPFSPTKATVTTTTPPAAAAELSKRRRFRLPRPPQSARSRLLRPRQVRAVGNGLELTHVAARQ